LILCRLNSPNISQKPSKKTSKAGGGWDHSDSGEPEPTLNHEGDISPADTKSYAYAHTGYTIRGRRRPVTSTKECIILTGLTGGWSSWIQICGSLGYHCTVVYYVPPLDTWGTHSTQLHSTTLCKPMLNDNVWEEIYALSSTCPLLIEPGEAHSFRALPSEMLEFLKVISSSPIPGLMHQFTVRHQDLGGVLDGAWTFASTHVIQATGHNWAQLLSGGRVLRHIIDRATRVPRSKVILPPRAADFYDGKRDCNALLPVGKVGGAVDCLSVFSSTGWVRRCLTVKELMLAFDVPVAALPTKMLAEQDAGQAVGFAADLPFLGSPPIKVFQHVMENWTVHDSPIQYESCEAQVVEISPPVVKDMYHTPEVASVPDLNHLTAPKADDAQAHQEIWDNRVWRTQSCTPELRSRFTERYGKNPLDVIRVRLLARWRLNITRGFLAYLRTRYGPHGKPLEEPQYSDIVADRSCLTHAAGATWWEWERGSTLMFWRWPAELHSAAKDGLPIWVKGPLPSYKQPQRKETDAKQREQVANKLNNVRDKGYIQAGTVLILTSFFAVPKGTTDIRMVYDATKSGLNKAIWVPSFAPPTLESLTDLLTFDSWMSDQDLGEMFLNFPLDANL
jgi:hypothetical protein